MKRHARARRFARHAPACALVWLTWLVGFVARAQTSGQLIEAHAKARGATASRLLGQDFLFEGQALAREVSFVESGCRAVFAWGGSGVRDVDLALYSRGGLALAEDSGAAPYAYARLCAAAGTVVVASAQAYAGRGEVSLFEVEAAPRAFGRPPEGLALATAAGGRGASARSVGGEEAELSVEVPLLHDEREAAQAGYVALGPPTLLEVRAGLAEGTLLVPPNGCFRVLAFVPGARGLMLEVESDGKLRDTRAADAELIRLALCAERSAPLSVRVRTRALRSLAVVRVFQHPRATPEEGQRFGDERALQLAEARVLAEQHGLHLAALGEAWVEPGAHVSWPIALAPGACQMIAALPARGVETELLLLDASGVVLARNEGRRGWAFVFACARGEQRLRVQLQSHGSEGPVSLWLGSDPPS